MVTIEMLCVSCEERSSRRSNPQAVKRFDGWEIVSLKTARNDMAEWLLRRNKNGQQRWAIDHGWQTDIAQAFEPVGMRVLVEWGAAIGGRRVVACFTGQQRRGSGR